jgi:hypothetical protein
VSATAGHPARLGAEVKTLAHAWREFGAKRSPRVLAAGILGMAALRIVAGGWSWRDAVAFAAMLVIYPFGEWAIHVHLLHLKPFGWRGRKVELVTARAHRMHHEAPHELGMILLAPIEALALLAGAVPVAVALVAVPVSLLAGPVPLGPMLTGALTAYVLIGAYEWTHFLIHTSHQPRSRYFRTVSRNHRLHHFKNEHYWHGITNNFSDRVLGTNPDHADVERSRTARTLDPAG